MINFKSIIDSQQDQEELKKELASLKEENAKLKEVLSDVLEWMPTAEQEETWRKRKEAGVAFPYELNAIQSIDRAKTLLR